jgi:hypothetical protein
MLADFDIVLYLDIAMHTSSAAPDSLERVIVTGSLKSSSNVEIINYPLRHINDMTIDGINFAIYIDPEPQESIIDRLRQNVKAPILMTTKNFGSDLYGPFRDLSNPALSIDVVDQIRNLVRLIEQDSMLTRNGSSMPGKATIIGQSCQMIKNMVPGQALNLDLSTFPNWKSHCQELRRLTSEPANQLN